MKVENSAAEIESQIRSLLPEIKERSEEFEAARRIPLDMVEKLRKAGCFRICVPTEYGGAELEIGHRLSLISELATADASTAWTVAIASDSVLILVRGPEETFNDIYKDGPDVVLAGTAAPSGTAEIVEGGYRVTGRWGWASGSLHAEWLMVNCIVTVNGEKQFLPAHGDGPAQPMMRTVVFPKETSGAEVVDVWNVTGLCGTGSNDIVVKDLFVADDHSLDFFSGEPLVPAPVYKSFVGQAGLILAAIAIGIARGALADIVELSQTRKQRVMATSNMMDSELLRHRLGESTIALEAITKILHAKAREFVAGANDLPEGPAQINDPLIVSCGAMGAWITARAAEIVDTAYAAGGGTSVWRTSTLQRRFRDMHTLTSHAVLSEARTIGYGQLVLDGKVSI